MNRRITRWYGECLALTDGDHAAAATLVLAGVQATKTRYARANGKAVNRKKVTSAGDEMLSLTEAARRLGYDKPAGVRRLVSQQKIKYLQNGKGPIRFRQEWIDEYIAENAKGPQRIERSPARPQRSHSPTKRSQVGFDSKFFRRSGIL